MLHSRQKKQNNCRKDLRSRSQGSWKSIGYSFSKTIKPIKNRVENTYNVNTQANLTTIKINSIVN